MFGYFARCHKSIKNTDATLESALRGRRKGRKFFGKELPSPFQFIDTCAVASQERPQMKFPSHNMGTDDALRIARFRHFLRAFDNQVVNNTVFYFHNFEFSENDYTILI